MLYSDKAEGLYESIVSEFLPTSHRTSFKSIFDEENHALALENADSIAKKVYEDEAKARIPLRSIILKK